MRTDPPSLHDTQELFWESLHEQKSKGTLFSHVRESSVFSKSERLDIYIHAYRLRLIEALAADFAATRSLIGGVTFKKLSTEYIRHYPSTSYTLTNFGSRFPGFLQKKRLSSLTKQLASFEWTLVETFYALPVPRTLETDLQNFDERQQHSPVFAAGTNVFASDWPLYRCYPKGRPVPRKHSYLVLFQHEGSAHYQSLTLFEYDLMNHFLSQGTLEKLPKKLSPTPRQFEEVFSRWTEMGVVVGLKAITPKSGKKLPRRYPSKNDCGMTQVRDAKSLR